jgi:LCP family protein required for cell wall assembly
VNGTQQQSGRANPGQALPPAAALGNRLNPDNSGGAPIGPGSRAGMSPVAPPSRPGVSPVGRLTATALAAPSKLGPASQLGPLSQPGPLSPPEHDNSVTAVTPIVPGGPERREDMDPACLTTEMEPISEVVEQKRKVDATLARFSAVHDEMADEERQRRSRRMKIMPWLGRDADLEEALSAGGPVGPATTGETFMPEDIAEPVDEQRSGKSRKKGGRGDKRRGLSTWKIAAGVAAVLVLIVSFFGWRTLHGGISGTNQIQEVAALDESSPAILESTKQYGDANFLLVGTGDRPGSGTAAGLATDTIMVVHIPMDGSRAAIVSFPPNLVVDRPACQQWDNKTSQTGAAVPAQTGVRLASVYSTGGPRCVTDTVQQLTGLRINHFVGVDANGFDNLVGDVQGGVQLCVRAPLKDSALGTIVGQAGQVTLTGQQALNFVRADQIVGATQPADLNKISRQQRFLAAALRKTISGENLLMSANLLNNFLATFTSSTFGDNMAVDQLTKLATSLQGLALGRITFVTLPTSVTATGETMRADTGKQLFQAVIDNSALPGEQGAAPTSPNTPVTPQNVKLQVINGIGASASGVVKSTANELTQQGYQISQIGGVASPSVTRTVIRYAAPQQGQARLLASSVPSATLQVDPTMDGAVQLVLGPGFDHVIQAPHGGGTGGAAPTTSEAPAGLSYVNAADASCA